METGASIHEISRKLRLRAEVNILGEKIYEGLFSKLVQIETGDIKK